MAANVLSSKVAIHASIIVVRTFIRMRTMLAEHGELKRRLQDIEKRLAHGFAEHEQELLEIRFLIAQRSYQRPLRVVRWILLLSELFSSSCNFSERKTFISD